MAPAAPSWLPLLLLLRSIDAIQKDSAPRAREKNVDSYFYECERVDVAAYVREYGSERLRDLIESTRFPILLSAVELWEEEPQSYANVVGKLGGITEIEGVRYAFPEFIVDDRWPYTLTGSGWAPTVHENLSQNFHKFRHPMTSSMYREVVSVGLSGPAEIDIAEHYHALTAMLLLEGEKVWALRPPDDTDCQSKLNFCQNPFDVCAHYNDNNLRPSCVQRPGETIIVPSGWHHGTCNNASVTIGWGIQGRSISLRIHKDSSLPFAHTEKDEYVLANELCDEARIRESELSSVFGMEVQTEVQTEVRNLFMQFLEASSGIPEHLQELSPVNLGSKILRNDAKDIAEFLERIKSVGESNEGQLLFCLIPLTQETRGLFRLIFPQKLKLEDEVGIGGAVVWQHGKEMLVDRIEDQGLGRGSANKEDQVVFEFVFGAMRAHVKHTDHHAGPVEHTEL